MAPHDPARAPDGRAHDDDTNDDVRDDAEDRAAILNRRALLVSAALAMPALAEAQSSDTVRRAPPRPRAHPRPCLEPPRRAVGRDPLELSAAQLDPSRMTPDEIAAARATMPTARPPRVSPPFDAAATACLTVQFHRPPRWQFSSAPRPAAPLAGRRASLQRYGNVPRIIAAAFAPTVSPWQLELLEHGGFRAAEARTAPNDLAEELTPSWHGWASDDELGSIVRLADALWRQPTPARVTPRQGTRELLYFVDQGDTFLLEADGTIEASAARELLQRLRALVLRTRPTPAP